MNAKIIPIFSIICIVNLYACGPLVSEYTACWSCKSFETNLKRRNTSYTSVEKIMVSYGINNDGCKFAALQCSNPKAKEILLEWYDPTGASLGITAPVKYTRKVIDLITCNQNSEWTLTKNSKTEIIQSATCEYIQ